MSTGLRILCKNCAAARKAIDVRHDCKTWAFLGQPCQCPCTLEDD